MRIVKYRAVPVVVSGEAFWQIEERKRFFFFFKRWKYLTVIRRFEHANLLLEHLNKLHIT